MKSSGSPDAAVLNAALLAYLQTFPTVENLGAFIEKRGLADREERITGELDRLLKTAEKHLWGYPGGVPWGEAFERAYTAMLRQKHPWLDDEPMGRIFGFSRWLCWHEGLNRPEDA